MGIEAAKAVENAITFEAKKDGLQQRQSGDWTLRLVIAGADMDDRVSKAPMGTRYQCVIVEINDDETPRDHKAEERDKWRALGATKQAGIRCKEPTFWAFLVEEMNCCAWSEAEAAEAVRDICRVASRADLDKPGHSLERVRWFDLDNQYQAWRIRENG